MDIVTLALAKSSSRKETTEILKSYYTKNEANNLFVKKTPASWSEVSFMTRAGVARDFLQVGDEMTFKYNGADVTAVLMSFIDNNRSGSIKIKDDNLKYGTIWQTKDIMYNLQFDAIEAFYHCPNGLSAGAYSFLLGQHTWVSADAGKTFYFTLTDAVPAGGLLVFNQAYNATLEGATLSVYADGYATSALQTATMSSTEIAGATNLGELRNNISGNFNSCQRALLGNNRWKESAIRQQLNSDGAAGAYWTPQTVWGRYPSWISTQAGFINGLTSDLTDYIAECEIDTYRNTVSDGGGIDTTVDKIFLAGRNEVFMPKEGDDNGVAWDLYKEGSQYDSPSTSADPIRVKKNSSQNPFYWWLRSPDVGYAHSVRNVRTDGSYNGSYAYSSGGVAPAFVIA